MSNETPWTPGPWSHGGYIGHSGFSVNAMNFGCVAERWEAAEHCDDKRREVMAANARLIAAAPEMVELLAAMLKHAEGTNVAFYGVGKRNAMIKAFAGQKELMQAARALLAKISKGA